MCSCSSSSKDTEKTKSKTIMDYETADMLLEYDAEKIGLISIIKDIQLEKTNSVLRDYLAKTHDLSSLTTENPDYIVKVIDTVARKNNLSIKIVATIIFSYKYEMITKDEIIEREINKMEEDNYEPEDPF